MAPSKKKLVSKRLLVVNSASSLLSKVLNATLLIWLYQHLLRRIDAGEYSLLPVVTSIMVFAPLLTTILTAGIGRNVVEADADGDDGRIRQIVSSILPFLIIASALVLAGGGIVILFVDKLLKIDPAYLSDARIMFAMLFTVLALRLPFSAFSVGLYAKQKFVWLNVITCSTQVLRLLLMFVALSVFGPRVVYVVAANVTAELASLVAIQVLSRKVMPSLVFSWTAFDRKEAKQLVAFGGWNFLAQLGATIRESADVLVLNRFASPVDVAAFHIGAMPDRTMRQLILAATAPIMPALTIIHRGDSREQLRRAFVTVGRYSLLFALAGAIPLIVYRETFYRLYLKSEYPVYAAAAAVLAILLASYPILYTSTMTFKVAFATGRIRAVALVNVISQMVNIGLTIYFVRNLSLGAVGSALGTLVVDSVTVVFAYLPIGLRMTDLPLKRWFSELVVPGIFPSIVAGFAWLLLSRIVAPGTWFSLLSCVSGGFLVYFAAAWFASLNTTEKSSIMRFLQRQPREAGPILSVTEAR